MTRAPKDPATIKAAAFCVKWPPRTEVAEAPGQGYPAGMFFRRHTVRPRAAGFTRLAALLALLALTFHGLLPLTQHLARQAQAANGIEQVVLCSALGYRTLAMKDGAPVDTDPAQSAKISKSCPVCLSFAGLQPAILAVAPAPAQPAAADAVIFPAAASTLPADSARHPQQARAPPALSLA